MAGTAHIKPRHEGMGAMFLVCLLVLGMLMIVGVIVWMMAGQFQISHSPAAVSLLSSPGTIFAALAALLLG